MDLRKLIFATNNPGKLKELQVAVPSEIGLLSLKDVSIDTEIPEDFDTLRENALQKARFIHERTGVAVIADDTGLEVESLGNRPGVFTARYAGVYATSEENMTKLLNELEGIENREARFRTVIALVREDSEQIFEGVCEGRILKNKTGDKGFGYDPVFSPKGYTSSFAEMSMEEKNAVSHRGKAFRKLIDFLNA